MDEKIITNPLKAIRVNCVQECCNGSANEVKLCPCHDCVLYPFRFGKNPFRKARSDAQKEASRRAGERLKLAAGAKKNP